MNQYNSLEQKPSTCNFLCSLVWTGCFVALWATILSYSVGPWVEAHSTFNPNVLYFVQQSAGFMMAVKALHLLVEILKRVDPEEGTFFKAISCLNSLIILATFCFLIVWSIMGASWISSEGLDASDAWFKNAVIITCVFTFLFSWLPLTIVFLVGIVACIVCCCITKKVNEVTREVQSPSMNQENQKKILAQEIRTARIMSAITWLLTKSMPKQTHGLVNNFMQRPQTNQTHEIINQQPGVNNQMTVSINVDEFLKK